ncbi:MAG: hypothetical protein PF795_09980 [Kiritimatiellae bacterium]|jgi:surface antigen|nr:hypothetical protein [Kiritimatiellia bacterium]
MRIRLLQRTLFGSILLLLALMVFSGLWIHSVLNVNAATAGPGPEVPKPVTTWNPEFPDTPIWAEPGMEAMSGEVEAYQLAGTFQTFEQEDGSSTELRPVASVALVDDLRSGRQHLVRQGDLLGPFQVRDIGTDQLTLVHEDQVWILALSGETVSRERTVEIAEEETAPIRLEDLPALETTPFGKRVAEHQWVIDRQAVFDYAGDIMGNPLRAAQLYRSFRQVADTEEDEAGFQIGMKGEKSFFGDMGLGDGDIIRNVNSMQMKSQLRAEYLVREFMHSRMSAVV